MLIDTHSHIYLDEDFAEDRAEVIQRLKDAGVGKVIFPNIDLASIEQMDRTIALCPTSFYRTMGLHPTEVKADYRTVLEQMMDDTDRCVAIGEVGIDLYWDQTMRDEQMDAFAMQVDHAISRDLPIIIHEREAFAEVMTVLQRFDRSKLRGVFHCFGRTKGEADTIFQAGDFMLGIGGVLTYKKAVVAQTVTDVDLKRIVLETDAPYLSPVPHRGKRNETSYIVYTAQKLAEIKGVAYDEVCDVTSQNAMQMFSLC